MTVFRRDPATGGLTFVENRFNGDLPIDEFSGQRALAFAPGGEHLEARLVAKGREAAVDPQEGLLHQVLRLGGRAPALQEVPAYEPEAAVEEQPGVVFRIRSRLPPKPCFFIGAVRARSCRPACQMERAALLVDGVEAADALVDEAAQLRTGEAGSDA